MTSPFEQFRLSRETFPANSNEGRKLIEMVCDFDLEPRAKLVHKYSWGHGETTSIIIERYYQDGGKEFAWLWCHPADSVEQSLLEAERGLFEFIGGELDDSLSPQAEAAHERRQLGSYGA